MIRRQATPTPQGNIPFPDESLCKSCPTLAAFLGDEYWDDGASREPSTLTLRMQDGRVSAALNDREENASLYVVGDSIQAALKALEKQLGLSSPDWRKWTGGGKKKKG